ncbi:unnamed protein product [Symbiodinium sp. CCMP2592]|nr:unnamed protein product [Symbiodinium sp. CCMP2592]
MGGSRKQGGWDKNVEQWRKQPGSGGPGWQDWEQSRWRRDRSEQGPAFPRYESMEVQNAGRHEKGLPSRPEDKPEPESQPTRAKQVQKYATNVRKAEAKIRKATQEKTATQARWEKYQIQLKEAFLEEHARYKADLRRIHEEMEEEKGLQKEAEAALQQLMLNPEAMIEPGAKSVDPEAEAEWARMMRAPPEEMDLDEDFGGSQNFDPTKLMKFLQAVRGLIPDLEPPHKAPTQQIEVPAPVQENKTYVPARVVTDFGSHPYAASPSGRHTMPSPGAAKPALSPSKHMPIHLPGRNVPKPVAGTRLAKRLKDRADQSIPVDSEDDEDALIDNLKRPPDGPKIGHGWPRKKGHYRRIYDIYDLAFMMIEALDVPLFDLMAMYVSVYGCGWSQTLAFLFLLAELMLLFSHLRWSRPLACGRKGRKSTPRWCWILTAVTIIGRVEATNSWAARPRAPLSDVDLWRMGQRSRFEQLAMASQRIIDQTPLHSGGLMPDRLYATGPPLVEPRPPDPVEFNEDHEEELANNEEEIESHHISFWITSPYIEPSSIDVALSFPISLSRIKEVVDDSIDGLGTYWLNDLYPTVPQLSDHYGTMVLVPEWMYHSDVRAILIDARGINKGIFSEYVSSPITRFLVLSKIDLEMDAETDVYAGGALAPLLEGDQVRAQHGTLVQVLPRGTAVQWSDRMEDRLQDPLRWDPDERHPDLLPGRFVEMQTLARRCLHPITRGEELNPMVVAQDRFGIDPATMWLRAPTERPKGMHDRGRRVHSVVAVLDERRHPKATTAAVTIDLRPVGRQILWAAAPNGVFDPGEYVEGLQLPVVQGFSIVVHGGRKIGGGQLRVADGDLLEITLRPTADLTPTGSDEPELAAGPRLDETGRRKAREKPFG